MKMQHLERGVRNSKLGGNGGSAPRSAFPAPRFLLGIFAAAFLIHPAFAQSGRVSAKVKTVSYQTRSNAAIPLDWRITWSGRGILEGTLEYSVYRDDDILIGTFRSGVIVLTGGEKRIRTMLPPLGDSDSLSQLTLRTRFVSRNETFNLPEGIVRIPQRWQRAFVVCSCRLSGIAGRRNSTEFEQSLRFERFGRKRNDRTLLTVLSSLPPEDFPVGGLGYCGFDLVVAPAEGLAALRARQLRGLREWVDAGGSLVVVPGGTLEPYHVEFLNAIVPRKTGHPPFSLDESGRLAGLPGTRDIRLIRKGVGRVAVILGPEMTSDDYDSKAWKRMVWFLWKMQREFLQPILSAGRWQTSNPAILREQNAGDPFLDEDPPLTPSKPVDYRPAHVNVEPLASGEWLLERLMPETVNVVPLWVIGTILFVYLLVVGPVDYYVLGWLKMRKLTWVLFPVVTFVFAGFTVWLSHRYMQTDDRRRSVVFLDVGDEGEIVRANQIDLIFNGTQRVVETDVRYGLFTAMNHRAFLPDEPLSQFGPIRNTRFPGEASDVTPRFAKSGLVGPASFAGNIPSRYIVTQHIPQWTPQMNRIFHIAPKGYRVDFDWNSVDAADFKTEAGRAVLAESVRQAMGANVSVYYLHRTQLVHLAGPDLAFSSVNDLGFRDNDYRPVGFSSSISFIKDVCVRPRSGLFSLVSQISPTGGGSLEDLALLDATDPRQWLLLAALRRGDKLLIYRKLYRE